MKKVFSVCLSLVLMLTLAVSVFAAPGFVSSPSGRPGPTLEGFENDNEDCTTDVDVVPYSERDDLDDEGKKTLEDAYNDIVNGSDLLDDIFDKLAEEGRIDAEDLAVSDLFKIVFENCEDHDEHGTTTIILSDDTLQHFAGLIVYNDGEWGSVLGDKYSINGNKLTFEAGMVDAYAIVVNTDGMGSPVTGDMGTTPAAPVSPWMIATAVSALGLVAVALVSLASRKQTNEN